MIVANAQVHSQQHFATGLSFGQLADVPTAAERANQLHAGVHAPAQQVNLCPLVCQCNGLRCDHLEVSDQSAFVAVHGQLG